MFSIGVYSAISLSTQNKFDRLQINYDSQSVTSITELVLNYDFKYAVIAFYGPNKTSS